MEDTSTADSKERERSRRLARSARRRNLEIRRFRLGEEPSENLSSTTTLEERIAMVWALTVDAWTSAGREMERRPRKEWTVRVKRPAWMPSNRESRL